MEIGAEQISSSEPTCDELEELEQLAAEVTGAGEDSVSASGNTSIAGHKRPRKWDQDRHTAWLCHITGLNQNDLDHIEDALSASATPRPAFSCIQTQRYSSGLVNATLYVRYKNARTKKALQKGLQVHTMEAVPAKNDDEGYSKSMSAADVIIQTRIQKSARTKVQQQRAKKAKLTDAVFQAYMDERQRRLDEINIVCKNNFMESDDLF